MPVPGSFYGSSIPPGSALDASAKFKIVIDHPIRIVYN